MEVVVSVRFNFTGAESANRLGFCANRYSLNVVAVARPWPAYQSRVRDVRFQAGDILLVAGYLDGLTKL